MCSYGHQVGKVGILPGILPPPHHHTYTNSTKTQIYGISASENDLYKSLICLMIVVKMLRYFFNGKITHFFTTADVWHQEINDI